MPSKVGQKFWVFRVWNDGGLPTKASYRAREILHVDSTQDLTAVGLKSGRVHGITRGGWSGFESSIF